MICDAFFLSPIVYGLSPVLWGEKPCFSFRGIVCIREDEMVYFPCVISDGPPHSSYFEWFV
jgi:hypothetical protein